MLIVTFCLTGAFCGAQAQLERSKATDASLPTPPLPSCTQGSRAACGCYTNRKTPEANRSTHGHRRSLSDKPPHTWPAAATAWGEYCRDTAPCPTCWCPSYASFQKFFLIELYHNLTPYTLVSNPGSITEKKQCDTIQCVALFFISANYLQSWIALVLLSHSSDDVRQGFDESSLVV